MKLQNVSGQRLVFECGDEVVHNGYRTVIEAGQISKVEKLKRAPKIWTVEPDEVIDLEIGYTLPREGGPKPRESWLHEAKLADKLVPYVPKPAPPAPTKPEKAAR